MSEWMRQISGVMRLIYVSLMTHSLSEVIYNDSLTVHFNREHILIEPQFLMSIR